MNSSLEKEGFQKIIFELEQDEEGFPPVDREGLWAKKLSGNQYQLDNIPFFAYDVSWGDIISVVDKNGELFFANCIESSGHQTMRVVPLVEEAVSEIHKGLKDLACDFEQNNTHGIIALDIPPNIPISSVRSFLEEGERLEKWEFEESAIFESNQRS